MLFRSAVLFIIAGSVQGKRENRLLSRHEKCPVDAAVLIHSLLYGEDSGERIGKVCK